MNIPFYVNPDNTHCLQASLKMVIEAFYPRRIYGYRKLDMISSKKEGLWTWPLAGLKWMFKNGFDIRVIEFFDLKAFVEEPEGYLYRHYGNEVAKAQIEHSDIASEITHARSLCENPKIIKKIPSLHDLRNLLQDGFLLIVNVNSRALSQNSGYEGHFVVVRGFDDDFLYLNDSGRDDGENIKVSHSTFKRAWYYPDEKAGNCYAFKKLIV